MGRGQKRSDNPARFDLETRSRLDFQIGGEAKLPTAQQCGLQGRNGLAAEGRVKAAADIGRQQFICGEAENLAGMGAEETDRMLALLATLKAGHAILLVEHDMDAVFRIADVITVMVNGAVIFSGAPDAVRSSREVQAAYLGGH